MNETDTYQCAIIGGGLAGLCLSIQMAKKGHKVILFEKNTYPFHKVCGEYISKESWDFLISLGLPLAEMKLPQINCLGISSTKGFMLEAPLLLGGFGISRHTLDHQLSLIAKQNGVQILENCKVNNCSEANSISAINTSKGLFYSKIVCGSYGKHAPVFVNKKPKKDLPNYVAVKYHIKTSFPDDRIELHNFKEGYCGISKVDDEKYCLCYLTTAKNLKRNRNDIKLLEKNVLYENPFLKDLFLRAEFCFEKPITISQVTFNKKESYSTGIFLLGDAAGAIAPLCGNGMSMAMRSSKILANLLEQYFRAEISKTDLIKIYSKSWNKNFSMRIKAGYYLQQLFGKNKITHLSLILLQKTPRLMQKIIALTHGKPF